MSNFNWGRFEASLPKSLGEIYIGIYDAMGNPKTVRLDVRSFGINDQGKCVGCIATNWFLHKGVPKEEYPTTDQVFSMGSGLDIRKSLKCVRYEYLINTLRNGISGISCVKDMCENAGIKCPDNIGSLISDYGVPSLGNNYTKAQLKPYLKLGKHLKSMGY